MAAIELQPMPLTRAAFAPYGEVLEISADNRIMPINYGLTERHHDLATLDVSDDGGRAIISLFRTRAISLPFQVKVMERHPLGSQAFMALTANPYLVLVAPPGEFEPAALRAFIAEPHQGVNYHKGTWHHYCLGLHRDNDLLDNSLLDNSLLDNSLLDNDFLVVDRGGPGANCDEVNIPAAYVISVNH